MSKYSLTAVRRHTTSIRRSGAPLFEKRRKHVADAIAYFDGFFASLHDQTDPLRRNVRLLLATRFFNHWYGALLLAESGLYQEAVICERAALEVMAFHWLTCVDPVAVSDYSDEQLPRPVVVRKRLEALGVDPKHLRQLYANASDVAHVSRASERFTLVWQEADRGQLLVAGKYSAADFDHLLEYLPLLVHLYCQPPQRQVTS